MGCVYVLTCNISHKLYIGKTIQPNLERYLKHNVCRALAGANNKPKLYRALRKYGPQNFTVTKLFESDDATLLAGWEKYLIKEFDCVQYGYNISSGGEGAGYKHGTDCKHCLWAKTEGAKLLRANQHKRVYRKGFIGKNRKEFCNYGHKMSEDNIYDANGRRGACKLCARRRSAEQRRRKNAI